MCTPLWFLSLFNGGTPTIHVLSWRLPRTSWPLSLQPDADREIMTVPVSECTWEVSEISIQLCVLARLFLSLLHRRGGDNHSYSRSKPLVSSESAESVSLGLQQKTSVHVSRASSEAGFRAWSSVYLRAAPEVIQRGEAQVRGRGSGSRDTVSYFLTVHLSWKTDRQNHPWGPPSTEDLFIHTAFVHQTSAKIEEKMIPNSVTLRRILLVTFPLCMCTC